jgi:hypothetical protein
MGAQVEGKWCDSSKMSQVHYDPDFKSSPVTTQAALFVAFTLMMMVGNFVAQVIDVKGAFLKGKLHQKKKCYYLKYTKGLKGSTTELEKKWRRHS